jgi:hypothetical protein
MSSPRTVDTCVRMRFSALVDEMGKKYLLETRRLIITSEQRWVRIGHNTINSIFNVSAVQIFNLGGTRLPGQEWQVLAGAKSPLADTLWRTGPTRGRRDLRLRKTQFKSRFRTR